MRVSNVLAIIFQKNIIFFDGTQIGSFWSFGHLVKIVFWLSKSSTINNKYIYYYSELMTESENENDHFDLDHFDHVCLALTLSCYHLCERQMQKELS